jgi:N-acetyl-gamma-glutamylphosphate reductase
LQQKQKEQQQQRWNILSDLDNLSLGSNLDILSCSEIQIDFSEDDDDDGDVPG